MSLDVERRIRHDQTQGTSRVTLAVLVFSSGDRVLVDAPLLIGRNPGAPIPMAMGVGPRTVRIAGPGVSRRHVAVSVDRWRATIEDLGSSNGTHMQLPGQAPISLVPGTPVDLAVGAVVDLGGDVSFTVEEIA